MRTRGLNVIRMDMAATYTAALKVRDSPRKTGFLGAGGSSYGRSVMSGSGRLYD